MSLYTTGELAKLCGVTVRTVQYYDSRGILVPSELSEGGRRLYSEADVRRLKIICFLRELGLPIDSISQILAEEHPEKLISILLDQQEEELKQELDEKQKRLRMLGELKEGLKGFQTLSVDSIGDMAYIMANKQELKRIHVKLVCAGLPLTILQLAGIFLWIFRGDWRLFAVWAVLAVPLGIVISRWYFRKVNYLCPECHTVFRPSFWEAFWAGHTPVARKLTCPHCGHHGFCLEVAGSSEVKKHE